MCRSSCRSAATTGGLNQGGPWAAAFANWSLAASFTAQSGTPYTARGAGGGVRRRCAATSGTLRADYLGDPIALDPPVAEPLLQHAAFAVPAANAFGTAGRNTIIGPSQSQLDAALTRDIRLTSTQVLSLRVEATNVLNSVRFGTIDTAVNSPTFGQVMSIRPMRTRAGQREVPLLMRRHAALLNLDDAPRAGPGRAARAAAGGPRRPAPLLLFAANVNLVVCGRGGPGSIGGDRAWAHGDDFEIR
jgi:hypothetical protein